MASDEAAVASARNTTAIRLIRMKNFRPIAATGTKGSVAAIPTARAVAK